MTNAYTPRFQSRDVVVFKGQSEEQRKWGSNDDANACLKPGQEYVIASVDVHSWHTKLSLCDVKGRFNSACFDLVDNINN